MTKHRLVKVAREAALHAGQYAFAGRHRRKSDFRRLWIIRISQAVGAFDLSYSNFIDKLKQSKILLDRKILADLVVNDKATFQAVVDKVKKI
jgi:large subunit ribosomal protein L20